VALMFSAGGAFAFPECKGHVLDWTNCVGTYENQSGKYVGEFVNGNFNGQGVYKFRSGKILEGIFEHGKRIYIKKTPYSSKPSLLQVAFTQLSQSQRKQVQSILSNLGFYNFSIDGLYGKGTEAALNSYNKQNLNGADSGITSSRLNPLTFEPSDDCSRG
jgi:hypothetical protein